MRSHDRLWRRALGVLREHGFEPRRDAAGAVRLRNCPFDALARDYCSLVCGMNCSMMEGFIQGLAVRGVRAVLDRQPGMCCVAFLSARRS